MKILDSDFYSCTYHHRIGNLSKTHYGARQVWLPLLASNVAYQDSGSSEIHACVSHGRIGEIHKCGRPYRPVANQWGSRTDHQMC